MSWEGQKPRFYLANRKFGFFLLQSLLILFGNNLLDHIIHIRSWEIWNQVKKVAVWYYLTITVLFYQYRYMQNKTTKRMIISFDMDMYFATNAVYKLSSVKQIIQQSRITYISWFWWLRHATFPSSKNISVHFVRWLSFHWSMYRYVTAWIQWSP